MFWPNKNRAHLFRTRMFGCHSPNIPSNSKKPGNRPERRSRGRRMPTHIKRQLISRIENLPKNQSIILYGAHGTGKASLLENLVFEDKTRWFRGDDPRDVQFLSSLSTTADLKMLLASVSCIVILEAQLIPRAGLLIKRLLDLKSSTRLLVTSSTALDLTDRVAERVRIATLWPLSYEEITESSSWIEAIRSLPIRLVLGSYPIVFANPQQARENLKTYIESDLLKDVLSYAEIRKPSSLLRLLQVLADQIGIVSPTDALARASGLNAGTVESYLHLLEDCFIIKVLPSYCGRLSSELKKSKKIYFCDLGLRNAILNNFSPFGSRSPTEKARLFENYFIMERIKFRSYSNSFVSFYFWRNKSGSEIDLIEANENKIHAFEIRLSKDTAKIPPTFAVAYPEVPYITVNEKNFYRYLCSENE